MVTIACVGDLLITRNKQTVIPDVAEILGESDLRFGNLETTFVKGDVTMDKLVIIGAKLGAEARIRELRFNILSLANNHILDYGYDGLSETIRIVDNLKIGRTGAGANIHKALKPAKFQLNGACVAFIGFSSSLPAGYTAGPSRPGVVPLRVRTKYQFDPLTELEQPGIPPAIFTDPVAGDLDRIQSTVQELKRDGNIVCLSAHWGVPFQDDVQDYQRVTAHALVDAGADLIIGHHPHVLHGIEIYKEKPILYSLGHFIVDEPFYGGSKLEEAIDSNPQLRRYKTTYSYDRDIIDASGIARITIQESQPVDVEFIPSLAPPEGPRLAHGKNARNILARLGKLSERLGSSVCVTGDKMKVWA